MPHRWRSDADASVGAKTRFPYIEAAGTQAGRASRLRRELPAAWANVSVTAWPGLTTAFLFAMIQTVWRPHGSQVERVL